LPQSSPFSPPRLYRWPNENALYFHIETSILVVLIQILIKKSHNFNCRWHGTLVASTHLWNTYHITFAASTHLSNTYHSNFATSTLIILFSEMLSFSHTKKVNKLWRKILSWVLSLSWDWGQTIRLRTLSSRQWIMSHTEAKHAQEEHQGVTAAISYFKSRRHCCNQLF
jgi:hypothetical protein